MEYYGAGVVGDPISIDSVLEVAVPEKALTMAVPAVFPPSNRVVARPSWVRLSWGSTFPSVVENVTSVPFWTGVPTDSVTTAVMTDSPSSGMTGSLAMTTIVDSEGASSGRPSQPVSAASDRRTSPRNREDERVIRGGPGESKGTDTSRMHFIGMSRLSPHTRLGAAHGYAMAGLLVTLAVMSVLSSMLLPVWSQAAQREREAELVFRGEQYARAVELYQRRFVGANPPDFETLVEQRFLRRLYMDPMTEDGEFQVIHASQLAAEVQSDVQGEATDERRSSEPIRFGDGEQGGVVGVVSRSEEESLRVYNDREKYNEWVFAYSATATEAGAVTGAGGPPGDPGGAGSGADSEASRLGRRGGRRGPPDRPGRAGVEGSEDRRSDDRQPTGRRSLQPLR